MDDADGPGVDVIVHAYARTLTEDQISEFESRGWKWHPKRQKHAAR